MLERIHIPEAIGNSKRRMHELARVAKLRCERRLLHSWKYSQLAPKDYSAHGFRRARTGALQIYHELATLSSQEDWAPLEDTYCHPRWKTYKRELSRWIQDGPEEMFLDNSIIATTMVGRGYGERQRFEESYLASCPPPIQAIIARFVESRVGGPLLECPRYQCSTASLGQLYYAVRVAGDRSGELDSHHTVIEFGGGFGNLARIYKSLFPQTTYCIIDLPEMLPLQYLFLRLNFPGLEICIHKSSPIALKRCCFNLIPVYLLQQGSLEGDIFVSTFALSEAPEFVQNLVGGVNRFYSCDQLYLTGQCSNPTDAGDWVSHTLLHTAIRSNYARVQVIPFHGDYYEVLASCKKCA